MMRTIDVHNHLFPKEWIDYLGKRTESPRMERKGDVMVFYSHNVHASRIIHRGHYDPDVRIKDMDKCSIDTQIVSLTIPGVEELPVDEGVKWSRKINDYFAEVSYKYPGRFYAYATLPYQDVDEALKELDRAYKELNVNGLTIYSNINFKRISIPEFFPIYAKAEEYGLPIFVHPGIPFTYEIMMEHKLFPGLYGFTLDTTIAVMSLIWQGVLEKYPGLNIIHAHLGGVVPYLVQRMEDCWRANLRVEPPVVKLDRELPNKPSEYYKRQVYPDSMSGYLPAIKCCLDFVGSKHICLGTDYAHTNGNWENAIAFIRKLDLSEKDTNDILGGNAARIFNLT